MIFVSSRQFDVGSEATVELKSIFGKPFDHGPFLRTTRNLPFRNERQDDHLYAQSEESHLQKNCRSGMCSFILTSFLHFILIFLLNVRELCQL